MNDKHLIETTLTRDYRFRGKIINLRVDDARLPNGKTAVREVVEHPGGVCVAPLTGDDQLLFVRQFRYPYGKVLLELPAGKLSPGEDPLSCGMRELEEETGMTAARYTSLGRLYPSPGYCDEVIHLYLADRLTAGTACPDEDEFLETVSVPLVKALKMVMEGDLTDAKTVAAVLKVAMIRRCF